MKTVGIIAEYNPFHKGHEYQIKYARENLSADCIVVAMSGDFVQRGTPALLSKHMRAEMALLCGADLVLELPVSVSTASAELFARGGVQLLDGLGVVDELCFGSEWGDVSALMEIARVLVQEPKLYREKLQDCLREGMTFPAARCAALGDYFTHDQGKLSGCSIPGNEPGLSSLSCYKEILSSPNNILGIEYCKALLREKSSIRPVTVKRMGSGYHDTELRDSLYPSASAIRKSLQTGSSPSYGDLLSCYENAVPAKALSLFCHSLEQRMFLTEEDFNLLFRYRLLKETPESLQRYLDMSPELARRICRVRNEFSGFGQFSELLKTKEVTRTRVQRALLHMLLQLYEAPEKIPYARILGFRRKSGVLLKEIKNRGRIPLISKLADAPSVLESWFSSDLEPSPACIQAGIQCLEETTFASNLWQSLLAEKTKAPFIHEYQKPVIIL